MPFTFFNLLYWTMLFSVNFISAKILVRGWKPHLKESIYIALASLFNALAAIILSFFVSHVWDAPISMLLVFFYFFKIKSYSVKKSFTLTFLATMIASVANLLVLAVISFLFPVYFASIAAVPLQVSFHFFLQLMPSVLVLIAVTALVIFLFVKATRKLRERINQSEKAQTVLTIISVSILALMQIAMTIMYYQNEFLEFVTSWEIFFLFGFSFAILVSFLFYARSLRIQSALQQKEAEQNALQYYMREVDEYQTHVSKVLHDVGNILSAMEGYLGKDDLAGAKDYFYKKIMPETATITETNNALARLANIKVPEVRALIVQKLREAHEAGVDITVEATDEIDHIPVDSIALVRMLGIILDNAIEELIALGEGKLVVICYKAGDGVTFVVQNTCRPDIQKLHELTQVGFSTKGKVKGKKRGLGLNNLEEIANAHNIMLYPEIKDGNFTQKLRIGAQK